MDAQTSTLKDAPVPDRAATDDGLLTLSYLLSGILFYGGLGWAGWKYLDQLWTLPVGLIVGMVTSLFLIVRRYSPPSTPLISTTDKEQ